MAGKPAFKPLKGSPSEPIFSSHVMSKSTVGHDFSIETGDPQFSQEFSSMFGVTPLPPDCTEVVSKMREMVEEFEQQSLEPEAEDSTVSSPEATPRKREAIAAEQQRTKASLESMSELKLIEKRLKQSKLHAAESATSMSTVLKQMRVERQEREQKLHAAVPEKMDKCIQVTPSDGAQRPLAERMSRRRTTWGGHKLQEAPRKALEFKHYYESLIRELKAAATVRVQLSAEPQGFGGALLVPEQEGLQFQDGVGRRTATCTLEGPVHRVNASLARGSFNGQALGVQVTVMGARAPAVDSEMTRTAPWRKWMEKPWRGRISERNANNSLSSQIAFLVHRAPELSELEHAFPQFLELWAREEFIDGDVLQAMNCLRELTAVQQCLVDFRDELREAFFVSAVRGLHDLPDRLRVDARGFVQFATTAQVIVRELGMGGHAAALAERDVRLAFLETLHVVDHRHKDELPQLSKEKQDMVAAMSFVEDYDLTLTLFEWNLAILHLSVRWACASGMNSFSPSRSLKAFLLQALDKVQISWGLTAVQYLDIPEVQKRVDLRRPQFDHLYEVLFGNFYAGDLPLEAFVKFLRHIGLCDKDRLGGYLHVGDVVEAFYGLFLRDCFGFDSFPEVLHTQPVLHRTDFAELGCLVGLLPLLDIEKQSSLAVELDRFLMNVVFVETTTVYSSKTDEAKGDTSRKRGGRKALKEGLGEGDIDPASVWIRRLAEFDVAKCQSFRRRRFAFLR